MWVHGWLAGEFLCWVGRRHFQEMNEDTGVQKNVPLLLFSSIPKLFLQLSGTNLISNQGPWLQDLKDRFWAVNLPIFALIKLIRWFKKSLEAGDISKWVTLIGPSHHPLHFSIITSLITCPLSLADVLLVTLEHYHIWLFPHFLGQALNQQASATGQRISKNDLEPPKTIDYGPQ